MCGIKSLKTLHIYVIKFKIRSEKDKYVNIKNKIKRNLHPAYIIIKTDITVISTFSKCPSKVSVAKVLSTFYCSVKGLNKNSQ